jgi:hypothetical protein
MSKLLTYLLSPWSRVLLEKLTVNFAASQEIPHLYGTRKFLTVHTSARHLSLSLANSIQSPRLPSNMSLFLLRLRDTSSRNTPSRRSEWGSSLPPDCFVSRGSISTWVILNIRLLRRGVISTSPNPQARGPPLVGCPRLLIQFIHSYPPYRRPVLHPQTEDAPCRGDRDPHSWKKKLHNL